MLELALCTSLPLLPPYTLACRQYLFFGTSDVLLAAWMQQTQQGRPRVVYRQVCRPQCKVLMHCSPNAIGFDPPRCHLCCRHNLMQQLNEAGEMLAECMEPLEGLGPIDVELI